MTKWAILDLLAANVKATGKVELAGKDGKVHLVGGALGEIEGCSTFVEETTLMENCSKKDSMWQTKYYGVSYWFKGITDNEIIDRVTTVKKVFMEAIKLLLKNWYLLPSILIFRKRFIRLAINSFDEIYRAEGGLESKTLKQEEFCPSCQELIKAGKKHWLAFCFAMFLQFSWSYRSRFQDIFGEMDKDNFKIRPRTELLRLKRIILQREKDLPVVAPRMNMFFWLAIVALTFKEYRKIAIEFVSELDIEKIKLDETDYYYCLRRPGYNFRGVSIGERLKEAERIDKEKNHLILGL